ncbi:glycine oxidase ThiO [Miltoncostaea marina]|uniref:glycine oxidase ThiO n=1 Tax=Miltoncostaea marina TaxID=2843215 RepID=UPI002484BE0F|nr:glycine oxidase ThiO [Miltoncostaea marina]
MVGAGPWGLMTAWRAAAAGARVRLIDDGEAPAGSVAAGMLGPWAEAEEGERPMHELMLRALAAWPATARELGAAAGADAGFRVTGAVLAAARPEHVGVVRRRLATLASWGEPFGWLPGGRLRAVEPGLGPAVAGGADLPDEHQVEPRALLRALGAACEAAGVERVAGAARALLGRPVRGVRLEDGRELRAGRVVLAAGRAAGRLASRVPIRPVKGQVLRLRATAGAPLPVARTVRTPSVYLAPRDGELVVGATSEERSDRTVTAVAVADLLREALRVVPEVAELELAEAAAGLRPATPDGHPALGADPDDGLVWAAGGHRHGILLAPLAAEAAVAAAAGGPLPAWASPFAPERFPACG